MDTNKIIGNNIKSYRKKMGLYQEDVAEFMGVKRELVSYYENGQREIPLEKLTMMSDLFGVDLIDLMEEDSGVHKANVAFAFRTKNLNPEDMNIIAEFGKIVKNYIKIRGLCERHDC